MYRRDCDRCKPEARLSCEYSRLSLVTESLQLHCRFSKYRVFGEWFSWSNELSEFIASECLSTGAAAAVCSMNLYCSDCERAEFNKWHLALYDSADALRDVTRACTCQSQADALHASNKILSLLSQIPWIYE